MTAISRHTETAYRGVDLTLSITYTPPAEEERAGLAILAALHVGSSPKVAATSVAFDPATGAITAQWDEATTARLTTGALYEARFVRSRGGQTRVFYVRPVTVR